MSTNRRTYDAEFKKDAVALIAEVGKRCLKSLPGLSSVSVHAWHPAQYLRKEEGKEKTGTASLFS